MRYTLKKIATEYYLFTTDEIKRGDTFLNTTNNKFYLCDESNDKIVVGYKHLIKTIASTSPLVISNDKNNLSSVSLLKRSQIELLIGNYNIGEVAVEMAEKKYKRRLNLDENSVIDEYNSYRQGIIDYHNQLNSNIFTFNTMMGFVKHVILNNLWNSDLSMTEMYDMYAKTISEVDTWYVEVEIDDSIWYVEVEIDDSITLNTDNPIVNLNFNNPKVDNGYINIVKILN